jgi:hypothetical protein
MVYLSKNKFAEDVGIEIYEPELCLLPRKKMNNLIKIRSPHLLPIFYRFVVAAAGAEI